VEYCLEECNNESCHHGWTANLMGRNRDFALSDGQSLDVCRAWTADSSLPLPSSFETEGMFILPCLSDTVKLLPSTEYSSATVTHWLNAKYSNRVLHKVGLCIALHDILSVSDGALKYDDGWSILKGATLRPSYPELMVAEFWMTVFRPFVGEVLTGRIGGRQGGREAEVHYIDDFFWP